MLQNVSTVTGGSGLPSLGTAANPYLPEDDNGHLTGPLQQYDDPVLDFSWFLNSVGVDAEWGDMFSYPDANFVVQQDVLASASGQRVQAEAHASSFHPPVPDDATIDEDFHELKNMSSPWLIGVPQRNTLIGFLRPYHALLAGFQLPSKLALGRYVTGYVDGFSNHHSFIHIPTLNITSYRNTPELALAILAIGAQYRYETRVVARLYQAARAIVLDRFRKGELSTTAGLGNEKQSPFLYDTMDRLRSLLHLAIFSSWQKEPDFIRTSLEYQSLLASLLRNISLPATEDEAGDDWQRWISSETDIRTIFYSFCFLNIQTLAFDRPPLILNRDIDLRLPSSCREWASRSPSEWLAARAVAPDRVSFAEILKSQFSNNPSSITETPLPSCSPMGNYILIHALIQRIYHRNQIARDLGSETLRVDHVDQLEHDLDRWRIIWKCAPESAPCLFDTYGSLAFSATAFLGVAHVRLHCDLGPWRDLASVNSNTISHKMLQCELPQRGLHLKHAILHSIHALSISTQVGVAYLSRRQCFSWSINHVLCGLEFAVFTSKWLSSVANTLSTEPLSDFEHRAIQWIVRVVREGLQSHDSTLDLAGQLSDLNPASERETVSLLVYIVPKLWAQMFISCNSAWPIARVIGESLFECAKLVIR